MSNFYSIMFAVAPNPTFINLGIIHIRWYGLIFALGFLFTYWYLRQQVKKNKLDLKIDDIDSFIIYAIVGVVVGARIGEFIFFQTQRLLSDPLAILRLWEGGLSFHGGIIGLSIAIILFIKKYKLTFYELSDHIVVPGALVLFFGRIANFVNSELIGTITNVPWGVNWWRETTPGGELVFRHPSQIYEALKNLLTFGVLVYLQDDTKTKKKYPIGSGYYTWLFILFYGVLRTVTNIWREDVRFLLGLSTGQILSSIMAIVAVIVLFKYYWKKKK